jgi:hypothetical protein
MIVKKEMLRIKGLGVFAHPEICSCRVISHQYPKAMSGAWGTDIIIAKRSGTGPWPKEEEHTLSSQ